MSNKPKIRFKEYTDDWEQRKVSGVAEIVAGGTPSTKISSYWEPKEVPWLSSGEVHKKYITFTDNMISQEGMDNSSAKMIKENSVLIALAGQGKTRGTVAINRIPLTTNQSIAAMTFNDDIVPEFVFCNLENRYDEIRKMSSGDGARGGLNKQLVGDIEIPYTSFEEQKKIGGFFENLDNLITLHQRKCDETKELKKYMLQKMFPEDGEKVPEIRFDGFTDDWEQRKLIEICDYVDYRGKTPTKTEDGIFLVTAKNVKDGYIDYEASKEYISEEDYEEVMHRGKPELGDVLITTEAPCGNVAQVNRTDIALAQRIIKYRGHENIIDNTFLKHYLLAPEFQTILMAKSSGGTVKGIKGSILHQQKVKYPQYEEQIIIGSYLDNLDNLITLHQRKCETLKAIKKFMLRHMFV